MLRDIFVILIILGFVRYSFKGAFYMLLFYLWIAYFRPDAWIWEDWITKINLSFTMGAIVVVATILAPKERLTFGLGPLLLLVFLLLGLLSTMLSAAFATSWTTWLEFARVIAIAYAIIVLVTDEQRLRLVLTTIALSLAFEGAKQGWVTLIRSPGAANMNPFKFLGDNNGVAVGMLMLVPILTALARTSKYRVEAWAERFLAVGVLYRALSTYSRGGFLASIVLGLHYLIRSKLRIGSIIGIILVGVLVVPVLPDAFWERMSTIGDATVDQSAIDTNAEATDRRELDTSISSRLHFWQVAIDMAADRPLIGVGMLAYNSAYNRYDFSAGLYGLGRSVHSSWFGALAELGYPGLVIFIYFFVSALFTAWKSRRFAKRRPDMANLAAYAGAIEGALVVFIVGGSFVNFQYSELLWHMFALSIVTDRIIHQRARETQPNTSQAAIATTLVPSMSFARRIARTR